MCSNRRLFFVLYELTKKFIVVSLGVSFRFFGVLWGLLVLIGVSSVVGSFEIDMDLIWSSISTLDLI